MKGINIFQHLVSLSEAITGISRNDFLSRKRHNKYIVIRASIMQVMRDLDYTLTEIGELFGKDHTTVIHNLKTAKGFIDVRDKEFMNFYNELSKDLQTKPEKEIIKVVKRNSFMGGSIYTQVGLLTLNHA